MDVDQGELHALYQWVDEVPLSRQKRNIARDFADGVLTAELVAYYFPRLVELHNYSAAHSMAQKLYNWTTLNQKVFKRLGFLLARAECEACARMDSGAIERVLKLVRLKLAKHAQRTGSFVAMHPSLLLEGPAEPMRVTEAASESHSNEDASTTEPVRMSGVHAVLAGGSGKANDAPRRCDLPRQDARVQELEDAVKVQELQLKVKKLEKLVRLKDAKIMALSAGSTRAQDMQPAKRRLHACSWQQQPDKK